MIHSTCVQLEEKVRHCTACELAGSGYALQRVTGNGRVLIVGEAPGKKEAETGLPFVGRSGKTLDMWLEYMDLKDYVITNVVKHHPPQNHTPSSSQVRVCLPIMDWEVSQLRPSAILLIGKTPVRILGSRFWKMKQDQLVEASMSGSLFYKGIPLFSLPHPAYLIRKGYEKKIPDSLKKLLSLYAGKIN